MEDYTQYKNLVRQRAMADTKTFLGFGIEAAYLQVLANVVVFGVLAALGYVTFVGGELLALATGAAVYVLFVGSVFFWKYTTAPAKIYAQLGADWQYRFNGVSARVNELENILRSMPNPELEVIRDGGKWWLKITNRGADAEFSVKIDLSGVRMGKPQTPVHAKWGDNSEATSREISSEAWDKIFLMETEYRDPTFTNMFHWVGDQYASKHTNSWMPGNADTIKPTGDFSVYVSSKPSMNGGSKKISFQFDGEELFVTSGAEYLSGLAT